MQSLTVTTEQQYQRLIRKYPPLAARLHVVITVRQVAGGGYTVEFNQVPGEIYPDLETAQEARRALIYRELLETEYGYFSAEA